MFDLQHDPLQKSFTTIRKKSQPQAPADRAAGGLGNYGGMVGRSVENEAPHWQEQRREIWSLSRVAAGLLYPKGTDPKQLKGVYTCRWSVQSKPNGVDVVMSQYEGSGQERASYRGLQTCGLVWRCPACAARISETRRRQLNDGLGWAELEGHSVAMLTFTARHGADDKLAELLNAMKVAKKKLHQHRRWKALKGEIVSVITATEVTFGQNGWHPHFHMLVIYRSPKTFYALDRLREPWLGALKAVGLYGNEAAFDIQAGQAAGSYVAKWGAAEELTLSGKKDGKGGGKTPLQLLQAVKAGSEEAGLRWLEYAEAFKGRTQLDGLSKLVKLAGLDEVSDEEAAADTGQDDQESEILLNIETDLWRSRGRKRRTDILDAAETKGAEGVWQVLAGPSVEQDPLKAPPLRPGGLAERLLNSIHPKRSD